MPDELPAIQAGRRQGDDALHADGRSIGPTLLDFWRWSASDLVSNATRGVLAEFLVASALGLALDGVRDEWGPYDLVTPDGITIEVKASAYIQSWAQKQYSIIRFNIPKTRSDNANPGEIPRRQAQIYVFALLAHKDQASIDPLNVAQWRFYVLPTAVLNARDWNSIGLRQLEQLAGPGIAFGQVKAAVSQAASAGDRTP